VHSSNLHQVDPPLGNYPGKSKSRKQPSLLTLLNLTTQCGFILVKTNKMNEFDLASHRVRVSKSVPLAYLSSVHLNQVRNKLPSNLSTESWTMTSRKATSLATQTQEEQQQHRHRKTTDSCLDLHKLTVASYPSGIPETNLVTLEKQSPK
jgi:hypothetical protein